MKDEMIDTINAKISQNRCWMTGCAFVLAGVNVLVMLLLIHNKHPELLNMTDAGLVKSFFLKFS